MSLFNGGSGREVGSVKYTLFKTFGVFLIWDCSGKLVSMTEILMRSLEGMFEEAPDFSHSFVKTHSCDDL